MIRQPAETSQHDVFVEGQRYSRPERGLPFALKHSDVAEQFGPEFFGWLAGGDHVCPLRNADIHSGIQSGAT
jgi:hypothetical protein